MIARTTSGTNRDVANGATSRSSQTNRLARGNVEWSTQRDQNGWADRPEAQLNALLATDQRVTVAAAESCSGGGVAQRITSVSGSSAYFLGSIVAYSNQAKQQLLGVPAETLARFGAVSAQCAQAMASGARTAFGADIAVSTTGIAGPTGATERKPVGLVYIAVSYRETGHCEEHHFSGDRGDVVQAAVDRGLALLVSAVRTVLASEAQS